MSQKTPKGKLTLVATPIGNLQDLSPRAMEALRQADIIAAEDTRHSGILLHHFDIKKPMVSYYQHNEKSREEALLSALAAGKQVALVSDAGTPGISDPGSSILQAAQKQGFETDAIPGPCALVQALVLSGLPTERFIFEGFLPRGSHLRPHLQTLAAEERTLVFYESPHRLLDTLAAMAEVFGGQRQMAVCRELTKKFQEINQDTVEHLLADWRQREILGEFVLVVAGAAPDLQEPDWQGAQEQLKRLLAGGMKHKAAAKEVAAQYHLPVSQVYELGLKMKEEHQTEYAMANRHNR